MHSELHPFFTAYTSQSSFHLHAWGAALLSGTKKESRIQDGRAAFLLVWYITFRRLQSPHISTSLWYRQWWNASEDVYFLLLQFRTQTFSMSAKHEKFLYIFFSMFHVSQNQWLQNSNVQSFFCDHMKSVTRSFDVWFFISVAPFLWQSFAVVVV